MGAESSSTPNIGKLTVRNNGNTRVNFNSNGTSYVNGGTLAVGATTTEGKFTVVGATQTCNFDLDANAEVGLSVMGGHSTNFVGMTIGSANSSKNSAKKSFCSKGSESPSSKNSVIK